MFGTSWRVAKILGIDVRVDSSWVVIALLITYSMYLRFSILYKSLSTGAAVGIAILAAVLFFGSVLIHELAHALVSRARGDPGSGHHAVPVRRGDAGPGGISRARRRVP